MATRYTLPTTTSPISETSELKNYPAANSRKLSTVSSVTLHANTSSNSIPYEPLLPPISQSSLGACDTISHQPRLSHLSSPRWSQNNSRQSFSRNEKTNN